MTEPVIREARPDELEAVADVIVCGYRELAERMSPDAWQRFAGQIAGLVGSAREGQWTVLVAEVDGEVGGTVTLVTSPEGLAQGTWRLRLLAVRRDLRGRGVGTALVRRCIELAERDPEVWRLVLTVATEMGEAGELFRSVGFARAPWLDHEAAPGMWVVGYERRVDSAGAA